ncbi:hypothetical protein L1987_23836 [Smallanthus sonchifolius]|uniref:Uncharacterized protein n=1 Tax=Smallanthus sonchifolius TaxID=185202 RepID=A0ACB9IIS8_9ASTR|nr:hypothetical protein L1987_23836 [Smallanthus sonchifolius]
MTTSPSPTTEINQSPPPYEAAKVKSELTGIPTIICSPSRSALNLPESLVFLFCFFVEHTCPLDLCFPLSLLQLLQLLR